MAEDTSTRRPPTIDPAAAARWARRLPAAGAASPWLHEEVGRRMEDRLQWIRKPPASWLDWAPLRGGLEAHAQVARRYPGAQAYVLEPEPALAERTAQALSSPWWQSLLRAGAGRPRFGEAALPPQGVELLWANMALHAAADPQALMRRWHGLLATGGFLMFSCLGPDTLRELRALYAGLGWPPASHDFTDMHDWGDMLVGAGFAEPVMDMERIELSWSSPAALLAELRTLGGNLHPARFAGLRGRGWQAALAAALASQAQPEAGGARIRLTFEIVYGHAFKPAPRVKLADTSSVSLSDMREMLRQKGPGAAGGS